MKTARAKLIPVDGLPEWAVCCSTMRETHSRLDALEEVLIVDLQSRFVAPSVQCPHCGREAFGKIYVESPTAGMSICLELYDIDEGT